MATTEIIFPNEEQPAKLLKWRVRTNTTVSAGRVLFFYRNVTSENEETSSPEKKFRVIRYGRITKLLFKEGDIIKPGEVILMLEGCKHPTVMKDLCAECGVDLRLEGNGKDGGNMISQAVVPMIHSVPELKVCPELAEKIGKEDVQRLLRDRKLALLVDLDQTIVHTTNDNVPPNMKDVYHYQLYGQNSPWYHTRLRPNTRHFLLEMSRLYELHICTFGARNYAHTVASLLDKDGTLFSHRILSRDECFDPASKTANLKALFPCGDDMVCIIDDREDVWQGCGNLVQVKPYHFFPHTGDIHAPPGLEKNDPATPISTAVKQTQNKNNNNGTLHSTDKDVLNNDTKEESVIKEHESVTIFEESKCTNDNTRDTEDKEKSTEIQSNDAEKQSENDIEQVKEVDSKTSNSKEDKETEKEEKRNENKFIDEDEDDYLLYLEDILRKIHAEFYNNIEKEIGQKSLRVIIPRVRAQVLKGICLTFSGLIPTHQKLNQSRAYKVARAFGAEVTQDLTENTTHLVAIRPGTAKVNAAKKRGDIKIVNPDWLWACAERWEYVDERLFPLTTKARASRIPPAHCSSPEHIEEQKDELKDKFADSINPLMSFTQEEIEIMDKEVEEDMEDQDIEASVFDIDDNIEDYNKRTRGSNYNSEESSNDDECKSFKKKRRLYNHSSDDDADDGDDNDDDDDVDDGGNDDDENEDDDEDEDNDDDNDLTTRFRRGEDLPDDLDLGDNSQDSVDLEPIENEDDREWNAMGAALEREFLSE
uniref:RNA polymerase II subunit A C-terminal domain phosphatase isoform X1 n=2 Tax=Vespula vulgaris TaxID=7454 RepID=UPI0021404DDF|nr:RNA polymerase II subunit A C-terminal domain phosphatase isoform X1 [Vespula vulgaris]XP_050865442.1 RNA polymerase II subunit A C-terminal domain phosphatase isoform X1 [Vespula vulgaris]